MNANTSLGLFLSQLAAQLPMLIVYLSGIVLGITWVRRASQPAMFAVIGMSLMLLSTVGTTAFQVFYIQAQIRAGVPAASWSQWMFAVAIAGSIVRAVGLALVLTGVFAGRPRDPVGGFDVPMAIAAPGQALRR
jgi:hypothetical protein